MLEAGAAVAAYKCTIAGGLPLAVLLSIIIPVSSSSSPFAPQVHAATSEDGTNAGRPRGAAAPGGEECEFMTDGTAYELAFDADILCAAPVDAPAAAARAATRLKCSLELGTACCGGDCRKSLIPERYMSAVA